MVQLCRFISSGDNFFINFAQVILEHCVILAHGHITHIVHELGHRIGWEFAGRRLQPVDEQRKFGLVFLKVLKIGCSFLVISFVSEGSHFLLDLF